MIWGNHDIERQDPDRVKETLYQYYDERTGQYKPLFDGIQLQEGIALRYTETGDKILLAHGHQADLINDRWWRLSRFFVRYFWRQLQIIGVRDLTSPAQNFKKQGEVEGRLVAWVEENQQVLIAGHTHRSRFPDENSAPYFNTGSCVHPRCVTGIEIQDGQIALIKWSIKPNDAGLLYVARDILVGPKDLRRFFL
jgi:predicted phosphodiesterase